MYSLLVLEADESVLDALLEDSDAVDEDVSEALYSLLVLETEDSVVDGVQVLEISEIGIDKVSEGRT